MRQQRAAREKFAKPNEEIQPEQLRMNTSALPLEGIRVADFSRVLTGPYCTQTLGDLGADVIKIEPPQGDDTRQWGPPYLEQNNQREATYFLSTNRNKRSIALDLKAAKDLEIAKKIIARSDVLVENYRPGTLQKLGLNPETLMQENPRLIVCSITGFGSTGPLKEWAGYDIIAQGMSGFMEYTGQADGPPMKAGVAVADIFAGALAGQAILAALYQREKTGLGQRLEINLLEAMLALGTYQVSRHLNANENPERIGNEHRSIVPYGTYKTQDGFINIAGGNDSLFQKLCLALGATDLQDQKYASNAARVSHRTEVTQKLELHLSKYKTETAILLLQNAGVACGPVWSVKDAMQSQFVKERDCIQTISHPTLGQVQLSSPPFELNGQHPKIRLAPPQFNEHGAEILEELEIET